MTLFKCVGPKFGWHEPVMASPNCSLIEEDCNSIARKLRMSGLPSNSLSRIVLVLRITFSSSS